MKKNRLLSLLTLSFVSLFILQSYSGGYSDAIVANDPVNQGCNANSTCHGVAAVTTSNGLEITVLDASNNVVNFYENNTTYKVRISLKKNNITSQLAAGFQCTIFDVLTSNTQGSFPGIGSNTHVSAPNIGGKTVLTHKQSNVNAIVSGSTVNWEFDWKTSLLGSGNIVISAIANDANSNQASTGDAITYTSIFLSPTAPNAVNEYTQTITSMYPNPTMDNLNIILEKSAASQIQIYSITGQLVKQIKATDKNINLDVSTLRSGNYILNVIQGHNFAKQQFVKY